MHILYIHQHFATPNGTTGTRSYEFARRWVQAGHRVTLITGHYDIGGLELSKGLVQKQTIEGINVVVVGTAYSNKQSYLRRITSFLSFSLFCIYVGSRIKNVDVIYATSTPLTVGIPALVLKWLKRVPFVFEVRDQWPEIPIEMRIIKNKLLIKLLLFLEKTIYKNSAAIVALSNGMANGIRSVLGEKHSKTITVITNSCDIDSFSPNIDGTDVRKEKGWDNKFVLLHIGAMGKANGLDFVVSAAKILKDYDNLLFVLVGDGKEKKGLIERIAQLGLKNIEVADSVSKKDLPKLIAACDVSIVIFANYPILENNSANKFFDSLSAGKPVLVNHSGWQREILEQNNAGFGCRQYDVGEFVEKVLYLNSHREKLLEMARNARRIAEKKFSRDDLAAQTLSLLETTLS